MSAISVSWLNVSWGAVIIETNYGLMQHSYIEIKDRLLRALDSEYNVVDMATVFDVVAVLEKTPITPEILESTRLGKVINECRRRTKNEALARRAKHLVRRWRNMMVVGTANPSPAAAALTTTTTTNSSVPQQNGTNNVVRSPSSAAARVPSAAAISPCTTSGGGVVVVVRSPCSGGVSSTRNDRISAAVAASVSPALSTVSSVGSTSGYRGGGGSGGSSTSSTLTASTSNLVSPSSAASRSPLRSSSADPKVESVPKTHVANKRLRKNAVSPVYGEPPTKAPKSNGALFAGHHHHHHHQNYDHHDQQQQQHHHQQQQHHQHHHHHHHHHYDNERLSPLDPYSQHYHHQQQQHQHHYQRDDDYSRVTTNDEYDGPAANVVTNAGIVAGLVSPEELIFLASTNELVDHESVAQSVPEPDPPPSGKRRRKKTSKKKTSSDDVREKLVALSKTGRVKTTEELVAELKTLNEDRLGSGSGGGGGGGAGAGDDNDGGGVVVVVAGRGICSTMDETAMCATLPRDAALSVATAATSYPTTSTTVKPSLSNNVAMQLETSSMDGAAGDSRLGGSGATINAAGGALPPLELLDPEARVEREIADIMAKLPPLNVAEIRWDETPVPSPPSSSSSSASSPRPVTDAEVDRYLNQQWDGVNGCPTHGVLGDAEDTGFREWHEMVARRTYNDDLIHILPYSIVD